MNNTTFDPECNVTNIHLKLWVVVISALCLYFSLNLYQSSFDFNFIF
jgi:hypothetical protein